MKTIKFLLLVISTALCLTACGSTSGSENFVGYESYTFGTSEDIVVPITQETGFTLYESVFVERDDSYTIETTEDLNEINGTLTVSEQLSFADLDTYTYFLLRLPACENSYVFYKGEYASNIATITLAHFVDPDVFCTEVVSESFLVFKAKKST